MLSYVFAFVIQVKVSYLAKKNRVFNMIIKMDNVRKTVKPNINLNAFVLLRWDYCTSLTYR